MIEGESDDETDIATAKQGEYDSEADEPKLAGSEYSPLQVLFGKNTSKFNYGTVILFLQLMMGLYGFTNSVA